MTPGADQSAAILTAKLRVREPFVFVRLGDADVPWMLGSEELKETCDGEPNREGLGVDLMQAWETLCGLPHYLCGDLCTMDSPAEAWIQEEFRRLCEPYHLRFLYTDALLIHRLSAPLKEFYRVLREDRRPKLLVGPHRIAPGAEFLRARHVPIHLTHANEPAEIGGALARIRQAGPWDILLLIGGRASKILGAKMAAQYPNRTVIELGSALDPLFVGQTRSKQMPPDVARLYFLDLWWSAAA